MSISSRFIPRLAMFLAVFLAACASEPVLIARDAAVPAGVDFSGRWLLRADPGARPIRIQGDDKSIVPMNSPPRSRRQRSSSEGSVQVFLEYGRSLKVSQTPHGLFISYDRSVVEEFTFGENRIVNIGPIRARRVSGWEDDAFVVETVDESGTYLLETWRINPGEGVLVRDIRIRKGEDVKFEQRQVFDPN